ncbi:hypothetical protein KGY14_05425 [Ameyamaea chiangmaiensis]|uniref:Uncharacterized protein n=1 Tax=Ameyamaea chiangmaiensis TaxID=442969 RepID=A0A850P3Z7_9PROT|nr:hypothetical protein [Ameyamaea chiangmaiensis]MBS4074630.1 hypothetical protein [Ameyamaea chiangmaiensis]NVN39385.1 hypothetical protein [Ameyamaea chiangmaiensis]
MPFYGLDLLDEIELYLRGKATKAGTPFLDASGAALYSDANSLKPSRLYFLGKNPGGNPTKPDNGTIGKNLVDARGHWNAFTGERWDNNQGGEYSEGEAPIQKRVQFLCKRLGLNIQDVPASNLVFTRSSDVPGHTDYAHDLEICKHVHELIIDAVQPDFIFTHGTVDVFLDAFNGHVIEPSRNSGHGEWMAHRGFFTIGGRKIPFGNVPHLSRYEISDTSDARLEALDWATEFCPRD